MSNNNKIYHFKKAQLLPPWITIYDKVIHRFILRQGLSVKECLTEKPDEFLKYDFLFNNPDIPMFIAIFRDQNQIWFHIECAIFDINELNSKDKLKLIEYCLKSTWNLLYQYRVTISLEGYLSINTVARLNRFDPEHFEFLVNELIPYAQKLYTEAKNHLK